MLTRDELKSTVERIFNSLRESEIVDAECLCDQICCDNNCPFHDTSFSSCECPSSYARIDKIYNTLEYVESWAKEHPIVTMADKYKEVFGVEPKGKSGASVCPRSVGFDDVECKIGGGCEDCRNEFWHSEYKPPKREEQSHEQKTVRQE